MQADALDFSRLTIQDRIVLAALMKEIERRQSARVDRMARREHYARYPEEYFTDILGIPREHLEWSMLPAYKRHEWDGDKDPFMRVLHNLRDSKWTAIESATGTGKTFLLACVVFWFLDCFEQSKVVTTAAKQAQLEAHLWAEIAKLYPLFGQGRMGADMSISMEPHKKFPSWYALGMVAGVRAGEDVAAKAQGFHAEHMLIICDETTGIDPAVVDAFQLTSTAPHNIILAVGNPNHQFDTLHKFGKQKGVSLVRISAFDHPNVVLDNPSFIPGATTRTGIERLRSRFISEDNPLYLSRARGICPQSSTDSVIRLEWCYASTSAAFVDGLPALGVDVANSELGDLAAICRGKGNRAEHLDAFQCPNAGKLGTQVYQTASEWDITAHYIAVDGVGVGAATVNKLKEYGLHVYTCLGGPVKRAGSVEEFNSLRSQMWWKMRTDLENGRVILPEDEELFAQLIEPRWQPRGTKIAVEPKDEVRKRLGASPDKADAVVYWNWIRQPVRGTPVDSGGTKHTESSAPQRGRLPSSVWSRK